MTQQQAAQLLSDLNTFKELGFSLILILFAVVGAISLGKR